MAVFQRMPTRGERNNNPGNMNYLAKDPWRGQLGLEIVPPGETCAPRFGRYDTAANGIRAVAAELLAYQRRDEIRTVRGMINRWAPSRDHNDAGAYIAAVCDHVRLGPDDDVDLTRADILETIVFAVIRQENGRCLYDGDSITAACVAAF